jgi:hypothetical protein
MWVGIVEGIWMVLARSSVWVADAIACWGSTTGSTVGGGGTISGTLRNLRGRALG